MRLLPSRLLFTDLLQAAPPAYPDGIPLASRPWAMLAVSVAVMLAGLDTAIANTALPTIAADLYATPAASVWVVNAYQLALVATLLPFAAIGEIVGHQRVYTVGVAVFVVSSLVCALAWSLPSLTLARAVQGVGASGIMSVNTALLRFIYPRNALGRAVGTNALVVGVAYALGPTVASAILAVADWPWLFAINVPIGGVVFVMLLRMLPDTGRSGRRFDWLGGLLNAGTFGLMIFGLGEATHRAPATTVIPVLAGGLCFGALLLRRQASDPAPMLPVDLFRQPLFALSSLTSVCAFSAQGLAFVALPFYFQQVLGQSQVATGLLMTPWSAVTALAAPVAGPLSDRHPPGLLGGCGLVALCAGMALMATLPVHPSTVDIVWRMAVCGAGFGFYQSPNLKAIMSSAPPERAGGASGIVATSRITGQAIGAALVALCFGITATYGSTLALLLGAGFAAAGCAASFARLAVGTIQ